VDLQAQMQDLNFQDETNKQALSDLKEKHEAGQKELKQAKDQLEAARNELRKYEAEASFTPMKSLNEQQTGITDRERFLRLEAENRELKSKLGGGGDLLDELEMTTKLLETTKSKYTEAQRKILTLSQQNTNLTAPSTSSSSTTTTTTTAAAATTTTTTSGNTKDGKEATPDSTEFEVLRVRYKKLEQIARVFKLKLQASDTQRTAYGEALKTLKQEVQKLEGELKEREKIRLAERQATKLEQRLMASAFYEIGMELQQQISTRSRKTQGTPAAKSFLNKQRNKLFS